MLVTTFFPFPTMFSIISKINFKFFSHIYLSSATALNLDYSVELDDGINVRNDKKHCGKSRNFINNFTSFNPVFKSFQKFLRADKKQVSLVKI